MFLKYATRLQKFRSFVIAVALAIAVNASAQSTLDAVLYSVERNNKSLAAVCQFWEARKLEYQTGLTLPNPTLEGQYLIGSPATAGNQVDILAVQPFDFPTTYKKRRELAAAQGEVSNSQFSERRMQVLLETKRTCLEMIYRNKLASLYGERKSQFERLLTDFQKKLDTGEGNILDVNKTKLQLLEISQLQQENAVELQKLQTHLTELNGGEVLVFQDTEYPPLPETQSFEELEAAYEAVDPLRKTLEQEKRIAEKQLDVARTWRLPRFEAGYHYQGILGQRFNGPHLGITLPLWEQKYRTEAQQAQVVFADLQLQDHLNAHFYEIKELYARQELLRKSMEEYRAALNASSNTALLDKALRLGEISTIEYFLELSFYQNALLHVLKTEWDYQVAVAELTQFRL